MAGCEAPGICRRLAGFVAVEVQRRVKQELIGTMVFYALPGDDKGVLGSAGSSKAAGEAPAPHHHKKAACDSDNAYAVQLEGSF